ncbi:MAG: DnaJ domain-containing protein [Desulfobacterales bacterium]|nr:DnaJ domain-containing protein [Desulfobacterales bacterium]MBF0397363.1 DnaJ domain-containing protein [Desulfobacterales bacterium]
MNSTPSVSEVYDACRVLFGQEVRLSIDFLKYLQPSGIKAAYWKKAIESHPDHAKRLGQAESVLNEKFKKITVAYETLKSVVKGNGELILKENVTIHNSSYNKQSTKRKTNNYPSYSDHYYKGVLPQRPLLIGQFLYYSGHVSWRTLLDAVIWQKQNRPRIGQIALELGLLTHEDIQTILRDRNLKEAFGQCAIRKGILTPFNLMMLIGKQTRLQKPIGEYFIKKGIIQRSQIDLFVTKQNFHNRSVSLKK